MAHIYHEMHEIVYREGKSMAAGALILQVCAWEHFLVCWPIVDDRREPRQPIVYRYANHVTQPHLGKTYFWRWQLDDLIVMVWRPYRGLEPWDD